MTFTEYFVLVLLVIHRNFFAKAILEHPTNPLESPFASSFLSACRSATSILKLVREQYERQPERLLRLWIVWGHAMSAVVSINENHWAIYVLNMCLVSPGSCCVGRHEGTVIGYRAECAR